jgi:hypothetical protein
MDPDADAPLPFFMGPVEKTNLGSLLFWHTQTIVRHSAPFPRHLTPGFSLPKEWPGVESCIYSISSPDPGLILKIHLHLLASRLPDSLSLSPSPRVVLGLDLES